MVDCHQAGVSQSLQVPWTAQQILGASFARDGTDLHMHGADRVLVLSGWGDVLDKPYLQTADGKALNGDVLRAFDDHAQLASLAEPNSPGVATIEELKGEAWVVNPQGDRAPLSQESVLYQGSIIETGSDTHMRIKFVDEAIVTLGSNAHFVINDVYGASSDVSKMFLSILKGAFTFVSGLVARDDPETVRIFTPTSEIGIRGTKIVGEVDEEGGLKVVLIEGRIFASTQDEVFDITIPLHGIDLTEGGVRTLIFTGMDMVMVDFSTVFPDLSARAQFLKEQVFTREFNTPELEFQTDVTPAQDVLVQEDRAETVTILEETSNDESDVPQDVVVSLQDVIVDLQAIPVEVVPFATVIPFATLALSEIAGSQLLLGLGNAQQGATSVLDVAPSSPAPTAQWIFQDPNFNGLPTINVIGSSLRNALQSTVDSRVYEAKDIIITDVTLALVPVGEQNIRVAIQYELDGVFREVLVMHEFTQYGEFTIDLKETILTWLARSNEGYHDVLANYESVKTNQYYVHYSDEKFFDLDDHNKGYYDDHYGFLIIVDTTSEKFDTTRHKSAVEAFVQVADAKRVDLVHFGEVNEDPVYVSNLQTRYDVQNIFSNYHFLLLSPDHVMKIVDQNEVESLVFNFVHPGHSSFEFHTNQVKLDITDDTFDLQINIQSPIVASEQTVKIYLDGDIEQYISQFYKGNKDSSGDQLSIEINFSAILQNSKTNLIIYSDELQASTFKGISLSNGVVRLGDDSSRIPIVFDEQDIPKEAYITLNSPKGDGSALIDIEIRGLE